MKPLIRVQPTKDGGRRMLTDECKATVAAWMRMIEQRLWRQLETYTGTLTDKGLADAVLDGHVLAHRIAALRVIMCKLDEAFSADEFDTAFKWATEVMHGQPDDPTGSGQTGDAIGPGPSTT